MRTRYRFGGVALITVIIAWLGSKTGASGWEMAALLAASGLGLQMMAGINPMKKWTDDG